VLTGLTGVGQWTRGLVFRCVLGSEGCVLVPRSSGTPVATWAWTIWVVSRRRVLEAVFILLELSSPSRRIFIGSHSLPVLSGSSYWSFTQASLSEATHPSVVPSIGVVVVLGLVTCTPKVYPQGVG
jgi:hypothetical protein